MGRLPIFFKMTLVVDPHLACKFSARGNHLLYGVSAYGGRVSQGNFVVLSVASLSDLCGRERREEGIGEHKPSPATFGITGKTSRVLCAFLVLTRMCIGK